MAADHVSSVLLCARQDQVDTLTFQNRSLRDRAKRFEEALRKSTDEQILVRSHKRAAAQ